MIIGQEVSTTPSQNSHLHWLPEMEPMPSRKQHVPTKTDIGRRLRALRDERGMTQVELAQAMGIHQTNLSQMERGIRGVGTRQLLKLCRALKVSPDKILGPAKQGLTAAPRNTRLQRRVRRIEQLPPQHQEAVVKMLDAFLDTHARDDAR